MFHNVEMVESYGITPSPILKGLYTVLVLLMYSFKNGKQEDALSPLLLPLL